MGSTRLPGKVLMNLAGKTPIQWIYERLRFARELDGIVLATSNNRENDPLIEHAREIGLPFFRGVEADLVSRLYHAAKEHKADAIVRVTADCPLVDPKLLDQLVQAFREGEGQYDCVSNVFPSTYPDGLDLDVISFHSLRKMYSEISDPLYREWITTNIYKHPEVYTIRNVPNPIDVSHLRVTLDYPEDAALIAHIFEVLYRPGETPFGLSDLLALADRQPELFRLNERWVDRDVRSGIRSGSFHALESGRYSVGVVGLGAIGAGVDIYNASIQPGSHADAFYQNQQTKLVALCDTGPAARSRASKQFPHVPAYSSVHSMMKVGVPQIVCVAAPARLHAKLVVEIASYKPRIIICEKPLAESEKSSRAMIAACKKNKVTLLVNHSRRFDYLHREIKTRLMEWAPTLQGTVSYVRGIGNNGTHAIDLLRWYFGEVESVVAWRNKKTETFRDLPGDLNVDGYVFFKNGTRIALQSFDSKYYYLFSFIFYTKGGRISIDRAGFTATYTEAVESEDYLGERRLTEDRSIHSGAPRSYMKQMVEHVAQVLDGTAEPLAPGEDALKTLLVLEALQSSAKMNGKRVTLAH